MIPRWIYQLVCVVIATLYAFGHRADAAASWLAASIVIAAMSSRK